MPVDPSPDLPTPATIGPMSAAPVSHKIRIPLVFARAQSIVRGLLWLALPFILFGCFFHWGILDPTNVHWTLHGDWGQHALGWHAFQHSHGPGAFNHDDLLAYPTGLSVIYTDSNPLLALILKPLGKLLPDDFQYIGPWLLLCIILQVAAARLLLYRHTGNPWLTLAGAALLCLLPTFYNRLGHDTLMSHWLILMALWIYLECPQPRRPMAWAVLLGLSGLIHPYILIIVAAIWTADVAQDLGPSLRLRDWKRLRIDAIKHAAVLIAPLSTLAIAGAFSGQSTGETGFGAFSMGLDAPFNPIWPQASAIFKTHPVEQGQANEGFQYLGAGLLFLIASAVIVYWRERPSLPVLKTARGLFWPLLLLTLLALSNRIQMFGHLLLRISVPDVLQPAVAVFRASGRLFWPVAYLLVLLSLRVLMTCRFRWAPILILAALGLQVLDLQDFGAFERKRTEGALSRPIYVVTKDPKWQTLVTHAREVDIYPPNARINLPLFYEIAWRSVSAGVPVGTMYAARQNLKQEAIEDQARQAFQAGHADPSHLYVLISRCNAPASLQAQVRNLDGVFIIPPASVAGPIGTPVAPLLYQPGTPLSFGWDGMGACATGPGFAMADKETTRAVAANSRIDLDLARPLPAATQLDVIMGGNKYLRKVGVSVNGVPAGNLAFSSHDMKRFRLALPAAAAGAQHIRIDFAATVDRLPSRKYQFDFFTIQSLAIAP